jgi:cystathionine beta-lyase
VTYNFDELIDRKGTSCYKWDQSEKLFGKPNILPLWVADMDFQPPREVVDAIVERAKHGIYGYTIRTDEYFAAVRGWLSRRHDWEIQGEWVTSSPGVVPALSMVVQSFTKPGDQVILQSPVYYPFYDVIKMNDRVVAENPLKQENGRYVMDLEHLESLFQGGAKLLLLCTPHNPGGRVWTRGELEQLAELCVRYDVLVVADEIHQDMVFSGHKHIPFASLSEEIAQRTFTCIAPSKTFNLAGLQAASVIIPNDELRRKYNYLLKALSIHMESYFGLTAVVSSYTYGDEWLDQLIAYLEGNLDYLLAFMQERLPQLTVMKPEGTYLVWVDCRAISEDPKELKRLMYEEAEVAFNEGSTYGKSGAGWLRINIACPRALLVQALEQFAEAISARNSR